MPHFLKAVRVLRAYIRAIQRHPQDTDLSIDVLTCLSDNVEVLTLKRIYKGDSYITISFRY